MSASILTTVKKALGIDASYEAFDPDILIHINSVLFSLWQMGVGPSVGFTVEDASATWDNFLDGDMIINAVKPYMYMKVRLAFDPPATSFVIEAVNNQIAELENRIHIQREVVEYVPPTYLTSDNEDLVIGGGAP